MTCIIIENTELYLFASVLLLLLTADINFKFKRLWDPFTEVKLS
jgi:hypothetical protein